MLDASHDICNLLLAIQNAATHKLRRRIARRTTSKSLRRPPSPVDQDNVWETRQTSNPKIAVGTTGPYFSAGQMRTKRRLHVDLDSRTAASREVMQITSGKVTTLHARCRQSKDWKIRTK